MKDFKIDIAAQKESIQTEAKELIAKKQQFTQALQEVEAALLQLGGKMQMLDELENPKPAPKAPKKK